MVSRQGGMEDWECKQMQVYWGNNGSRGTLSIGAEGSLGAMAHLLGGWVGPVPGFCPWWWKLGLGEGV